MLDFLFPWSMAAGGVLIGSPILIHLINRMRFKRVRWAAMEFLLKSQKRNRRKLIVEQLLLLMLRILLVLLIALIVARFAGFSLGMFQAGNRQHVVVLDNTASMGDQWLEEGDTRNTFRLAKKTLVEEIAKNAVKASRAQQLKVVLATKPDEVLFDRRLNDDSVRELENRLNALDRESPLHVDTIQAVKKARKLFEETPQDQRILYLVSDFRQTDWAGASGQALAEELQRLAELGVDVKFVDVGQPARKETEHDARYHQNLAIVGLQPESKVVGRGMPPTLFKIAVANYGPSDVKNLQVKVKLNGAEQAGSSVPIPLVPAGGTIEAVFTLYLGNQTGPQQVSAHLDPEESGLNLDNTRYAALEVRETVPILAIDGDPSNGRKEGGDTYFLHVLFRKGSDLAAGYELVSGSPLDLEKPDLHKYPSIYLCNVRELNDKARQNLEEYVRQGGSVAFFLGERVNAEFYNKNLYANGTGLFPAPLAERPSPAPTKDEVLERMAARLTTDAPLTVILRDETHPLFRDMREPLYQTVVFRYHLDIDQHFPIVRARWAPAPGRVRELASLHNTKSVDDYKGAVQTLLDRLPLDDPKQKAYAARLKEYKIYLRDLMGGKQPLFQLAAWLDRMLNDQGNLKQPDKYPNLKEFWGQPELTGLRTDFERMLETVKHGDPLLIEGRFGKGRVLVCTTTLGRAWNNFGAKGEFNYNFHTALQKYLTSQNQEAELIVGQPLDIYLDATRYDTKMRRFYRRESGNAAQPNGPANREDLGEQQQASLPSQGRVHFRFADALKPGVYELEFFPRPEAGADAKPERRAFAFNIDTASESNLLRAARDEVEKSAATGKFYVQGVDKLGAELQNKQSDLSEGPWLYLLFLLVLLLEQALAVHLSFHLRGGSAPGAITAPGAV